MHWVNLGPDPEGLEKIRADYTPRWVEYYNKHVGNKPTDAYWRRFHDVLSHAFHNICGYCEEITKGEIDHFRPKSKFPKLVYCWTNWIFACHECNHAKLDKWPSEGYVYPCTLCNFNRPERYFTFDTQTGFILPRRNLEPNLRPRALKTIADLRLNDFHHLKKRVEWLEMFSARVLRDPDISNAETREVVMRFSSREMQFSSIIRVWLSENGYSAVVLEGDQTTIS